jgi:hypothetical protein
MSDPRIEVVAKATYDSFHATTTQPWADLTPEDRAGWIGIARNSVTALDDYEREHPSEQQRCAHEWQSDPRSEDYGVCSRCGAERTTSESAEETVCKTEETRTFSKAAEYLLSGRPDVLSEQEREAMIASARDHECHEHEHREGFEKGWLAHRSYAQGESDRAHEHAKKCEDCMHAEGEGARAVVDWLRHEMERINETHHLWACRFADEIERAIEHGELPSVPLQQEITEEMVSKDQQGESERKEQPGETRCPTCGSCVRVIGSDEGTMHYEPSQQITGDMVSNGAYALHEARKPRIPWCLLTSDEQWSKRDVFAEGLRAALGQQEGSE